MIQHFPGLMSQYLVLAHFLLNRETRWDVGIPGVYVTFSTLGGRLQSSHCQTTAYQQENNTSRNQCECTYTQHTGRQHMPLRSSMLAYIQTKSDTSCIKNTWTYTTSNHHTHLLYVCTAWRYKAFWSFTETWKTLKTVFHNMLKISVFCFAAVTVWETRDDSTWWSSPRHGERSYTTT